MNLCPKCDNKIKLSSIVKSTTKRNGLIKCDKCESKFRMKYDWFITIVILALMILAQANLNLDNGMSLPYAFLIGLLVGIVAMVVYIALLFFMPWEEK